MAKHSIQSQVTAAIKGLHRLDSLEGLKFRLIDAEGQVVGRIASQISQILMGKDKPTYRPERDDGDVVVVVNAKELEFTGRKWDDKVYRWHTGYPGGLKERTAKEQHKRDPTEVLRKAVMGMLPKNNLRRAMARKLRIFPGPEHDFENHPALVKQELPPRKIRDKGDIFEAPEGFQPFNPNVYEKKLERLHASRELRGKMSKKE